MATCKYIFCYPFFFVANISKESIICKIWKCPHTLCLIMNFNSLLFYNFQVTLSNLEHLRVTLILTGFDISVKLSSRQMPNSFPKGNSRNVYYS